MNPYTTHSEFLKALAHPTRLAILEILREGEQCVCHLEAMLKLRQAYISQQLMILKDAGLVTARRDGLNLYYRVSLPQIFPLLDALPSITGTPNPPILHKHVRTDCPCPKCAAKTDQGLLQVGLPQPRGSQ